MPVVILGMAGTETEERGLGKPQWKQTSVEERAGVALANSVSQGLSVFGLCVVTEP